jgi:hypothetical protein
LISELTVVRDREGVVCGHLEHNELSPGITRSSMILVAESFFSANIGRSGPIGDKIAGQQLMRFGGLCLGAL